MEEGRAHALALTSALSNSESRPHTFAPQIARRRAEFAATWSLALCRQIDTNLFLQAAERNFEQRERAAQKGKRRKRASQL